MTQQRPEGGYRGALPTRNDTLARWWVLVVVGIFVLLLLLSFLGLPSKLFPAPSTQPSPSFALPSLSFSAAPSASEGPSGSAAP